MSASAAVKAAKRNAWRTALARRAPAVLAVVLVLLGVLAVAVRLDAASDGTVVSSWRTDGVVVDVPSPSTVPAADRRRRHHDRRTSPRRRAGRPCPPGSRARRSRTRSCGRGRAQRLTVPLDRADPYPLLAAGWGNLLFVFALAGAGDRALRAPAGGTGDHSAADRGGRSARQHPGVRRRPAGTGPGDRRARCSGCTTSA